MRSWATIVALFLGVILIPFFLFEKASNAEIEKLLNGHRYRDSRVPRLGCLFARPLERRQHRGGRPARLLDTCHRLDRGYDARVRSRLLVWKKLWTPACSQHGEPARFGGPASPVSPKRGVGLGNTRPVPVLAEASALFA